MFDDDLDAARGSATLLAELIAENHQQERVRGCRKLVLAAAWADAHPAPSGLRVATGGRRPQLDVETAIQPGGAGTPEIAETCPAELAVAQQQSAGSARLLIGDALDLRHRLPRLWARVVAGELHAWKARLIASRSRYLTFRAAGVLDELVSHQVELMSWHRFEKILDAALLYADPIEYGHRAEEAKTRRGVWAGESAEGLRTLIIRACQGDTAVFLAAVNRVADLLADEGDEDPVGARRAKAVGILGNPAAALDLLNRHVHQTDSYLDESGQGPDFSGTSPWDDASAAGWADRRSRTYVQPAPSDPDYQRTQQPPSEEDPPEEDPLAQPVGQPAYEASPVESIDDDEAPSSGPTRRGSLDLRPVTRAERDASRPRVTIVFHLTDHAVRNRHGVVRTDAGPITVDELRQFLTDSDAQISVRPVIDPAEVAAADGYEIPPQLRRAMSVRQPGSVFPFGGGRSGRTDLDHTRPYRRGGPPGQTDLANLGPLSRAEHRAKTVGRWRVRQPEPGSYLWRSPTGLIALTTNQGTMMLGSGPYARQLWSRAAPADDRAA